MRKFFKFLTITFFIILPIYIFLKYDFEKNRLVYKVSAVNKSDFRISSLEITNSDDSIYVDLSPIGIKGRKTGEFYTSSEGQIKLKMLVDKGFTPVDNYIKIILVGYIDGGGGSSDIEIFNDSIELQTTLIHFKGGKPSIRDKEIIKFYQKENNQQP